MIEALRQILREEGSVRRAEELSREYKAKANIAPKHVEERIHSDELSEMEKNLTAHLGGKVKVTQSMREARMVIVLKGNIEKTGKVLRAIKQALESVATAEVSVDLEIEGNAQATSSL